MVRPGWDEQGDPTAAPHPATPPAAAQPPSAEPPSAEPPSAEPPSAEEPRAEEHAEPAGQPLVAEPLVAEPPPGEPPMDGFVPNGHWPPNGSAPGAWAPAGGVSLPAYTGPYPASGEYPDVPEGWRRAGLLPSPWRVTRADVLAGLGTVLALAVAGGLSALIWWKVAPRLAFQITADGALPLTPEEEQFFSTDAWFILLTLVWGVLAALALWRVPRLRGPAAIVTLAVGGVLGAVVTWRLGLVFGPAPTKADTETVGNIVYPALRLRALVALVFEPLVAVGIYTLLVGFSDHDLGRRRPAEPGRDRAPGPVRHRRRLDPAGLAVARPGSRRLGSRGPWRAWAGRASGFAQLPA
jgi:hypothetical protein